jgi:hypothetical protein
LLLLQTAHYAEVASSPKRNRKVIGKKTTKLGILGRRHPVTALLRTKTSFHLPYTALCNAGGVVHTAHDGSVVALWQVCNDRRLAWLTRSIAAVFLRAKSRTLSDGKMEEPLVNRCRPFSAARKSGNIAFSCYRPDSPLLDERTHRAGSLFLETCRSDFEPLIPYSVIHWPVAKLKNHLGLCV